MVSTLRATPGIKVLDTPAVEAQRWHFQLAREAGKDPRIRKAVSLAIDRNTIIKELLLGYARPVVSPIPPGSSATPTSARSRTTRTRRARSSSRRATRPSRSTSSS